MQVEGGAMIAGPPLFAGGGGVGRNRGVDFIERVQDFKMPSFVYFNGRHPQVICDL